MCFQEFYPLKKIQERLGSGYFISSDKKEFHTAVFSKYPIINEGLLLKKDQLNNIRFIDIKRKMIPFGSIMFTYNLQVFCQNNLIVLVYLNPIMKD